VPAVAPQAPPPGERLEDAIRRRIAAEGPLPFSAFVELALYDPAQGFYASGGRAGRGGDFLTSAEVGPLFGAVVGRAIDAWWDATGRPDPFVLLEGGAGPGTLARSLHRARPRCRGSLVHVLVERADAQRRLHAAHLAPHVGDVDGADLDALVARPLGGTGPVVVSAARLPAVPVVGVVLANELLDNLAFDIVRRAPGSPTVIEELRVATTGPDILDLVAVTVPDVTPERAWRVLDGVLPGVWVPDQGTAAAWVLEAGERLTDGRVVVLDYAATDAELSSAPSLSWLRTFAAHARGGHPVDAPGTQDITADVAVDQLMRAVPGARVTRQADWLRAHGIDELVDDGRRAWAARAHVADLGAVEGRSRVGEAEALLDPAGLGAFTVLEWDVHDGRIGSVDPPPPPEVSLGDPSAERDI
jgi:SAM-dependent MidA family methyltransferase